MSRPDSLKILIAASEAIPYAKTGGLADVAGALPQELVKLGHEVILVIPRYRCVSESGKTFRPVARFPVQTPQGTIDATIEENLVPVAGHPVGLRVWAIRHDPYFDRPGLYQHGGLDYPDNLDRFVFFSRAIIESIVQLRRERKWKTDLLHLHDWQTALCCVYLKTIDRKRRELRDVKTVLTLHNIGYQGLFPGKQFSRTGLDASLFTLTGLEYFGSVNLLKGGIVFSDRLTTVSPTYAKEILTPGTGLGLDGVLRTRQSDLEGILNGIDVEIWNPETDPYLPAPYAARDRRGKLVCKWVLQREFNLPESEVPLLAVIGRMTWQKGFDLIGSIIPELMKLDIQLVMLGTGDPAYEEQFKSLQHQYPKQMGVRIGFDEALAHRIEGGADMLVMPSKYEPCGLSQMYSLRYGTVPVVRRTGGLADTVVPMTPETLLAGSATGFHVEEATSDALLAVLRSAVKLYRDQTKWERLIEAGMNVDVSWARSARAYDQLFHAMVGSEKKERASYRT